MFNSVVVSVALDARDTSILSAISVLKEKVGIKRLILAHVHPASRYANPLLGAMPLDMATVAAPEGLQGIEQQVQSAHPELEVVGVHAVGEPYEEIAKILSTEQADLLAIGRLPAEEGQSGWGGRGLDILRHAPCPVLVVPHGAELGLSRVLVGVDFSDTSELAFQTAGQLGDQVIAAMSYKLDRGLAIAGLSDAEFVAQLQTNATHHFEADLRPQLPPGVEGELRLIEARKPAQGLLSLVNEIRPGLLVVGTRGLSPIAVRLLGSTAEAISGLSPVPVLHMRKKGDGMGFLEGLFHR